MNIFNEKLISTMKNLGDKECAYIKSQDTFHISRYNEA